ARMECAQTDGREGPRTGARGARHRTRGRLRTRDDLRQGAHGDPAAQGRALPSDRVEAARTGALSPGRVGAGPREEAAGLTRGRARWMRFRPPRLAEYSAWSASATSWASDS